MTRKEAIEILKAYRDKLSDSVSNQLDGDIKAFDIAINSFRNTQPKIKMGKWIKHDNGSGIYYDCSRCGCLAPCTETADAWLWKLSAYCPDCGAKMENALKHVVEEDIKNT